MTTPLQQTRKFNDKVYIYAGTFPHPDYADNAKDRLKYSAFINNRFVAFRTIKKRPMEYELYYRFHSDIKKKGK